MRKTLFYLIIEQGKRRLRQRAASKRRQWTALIRIWEFPWIQSTTMRMTFLFSFLFAEFLLDSILPFLLIWKLKTWYYASALSILRFLSNFNSSHTLYYLTYLFFGCMHASHVFVSRYNCFYFLVWLIIKYMQGNALCSLMTHFLTWLLWNLFQISQVPLHFRISS